MLSYVIKVTNVKLHFYIARHPVLGTVQTSLRFTLRNFQSHLSHSHVHQANHSMSSTYIILNKNNSVICHDDVSSAAGFIHKYTMPTMVMDGTNDQYFLPDESYLFFNQLPGPKYMR